MKVGDNVRIIDDPDDNHEVGDEGYITIEKPGVYCTFVVYVNGHRGLYNAEDLELLESSQTKGAAKNNLVDGKPDYSLIPKSFMDALSNCLGAGALKYLRDNYRAGHTSNTLTAAAARHLKAIEAGEDVDQDTTARLRDGCTDIKGNFNEGLGSSSPDVLHWACVAACALMAIEQQRLGTHIDDRWKEDDDR